MSDMLHILYIFAYYLYLYAVMYNKMSFFLFLIKMWLLIQILF